MVTSSTLGFPPVTSEFLGAVSQAVTSQQSHLTIHNQCHQEELMTDDAGLGWASLLLAEIIDLITAKPWRKGRERRARKVGPWGASGQGGAGEETCEAPRRPREAQPNP
jgi:hypothetical protein